ncbi:hypothetical protein [Methanohalophilus euhalobius]|uniref:hypothetical protein n=1 Tax=Methanohalophilus euhalobius TaxID=51203 RepID=UPI0015E2DF31|nr:hypothetical protein [Methanohalophilus euhalobius]
MIKEEQSKFIFATDTLLTGTWTVVDPIFVATPCSSRSRCSKLYDKTPHLQNI